MSGPLLVRLRNASLRCELLRLLERETAKVIRGLLCFRCGAEEGAIVGFEEGNPILDIARVPHLGVETPLGAQERARKLGDQLLGGV